MTKTAAERITGLYVQKLSNGRKHEYALYADEGMTVLLRVEDDYRPHYAIAKLVEWQYTKTRNIASSEQNYRCFHCYRVGIPLQADHIKPRSHSRSDARENLRMVCHGCHHRITSGEKLDPHPKMVALMELIGWRWIGPYESDLQPYGWERIAP